MLRRRDVLQRGPAFYVWDMFFMSVIIHLVKKKALIFASLSYSLYPNLRNHAFFKKYLHQLAVKYFIRCIKAIRVCPDHNHIFLILSLCMTDFKFTVYYILFDLVSLTCIAALVFVYLKLERLICSTFYWIPLIDYQGNTCSSWLTDPTSESLLFVFVFFIGMIL